MPPKKDPRRHAEVLDAAIALVRQKGIEGTSVQDIADAVGIKKGSVINYFSSKKQLAELIQDRFTEVAVEELTQISERADLPADKKLKELSQIPCAALRNEYLLTCAGEFHAIVGADVD